MPARVITGMPIEPKATGDVLANRQMAAALNGENPKPVNIAAATATGVPKPAAPSTNAPNAKPIKMACRRGSEVRRPTEALMISNFPVSTLTRNRRDRPVDDPGDREEPERGTVESGAYCRRRAACDRPPSASTNVTASPVRPAIQAGLRRLPVTATRRRSAAPR